MAETIIIKERHDMALRVIRTQREIDELAPQVSSALARKYLRGGGIITGSYAEVCESQVSVPAEAPTDGFVVIALDGNEPALWAVDFIHRPINPKEQEGKCVLGVRYTIKLASYAHYGPMKFTQGWSKYKAACRGEAV